MLSELILESLSTWSKEKLLLIVIIMEEIWRARHKKILENTEVDPLSSITQINQRFCEFDSNKKLKIEKQL